MAVNTATKIPAITQIKGLPPLAVMALQAIKETLEVREGLHEPLDRFVSVRELADLILEDEEIVTYLGSGHSHDDRYFTKTQWDLGAKGDLSIAQAPNVPGKLSVGTNNQLIRADSGAALGVEYFSLLGTSNQVTVTHNASDATLSLPQDIHTGASPTFTALTLSSIAHGTADYDKFLVSDAGVIKYRAGAEMLSDIGGGGSSTLAGLSDVTLGTLSDLDVLTYDYAAGYWKNAAPAGGGATEYAFRTITGITNDVVADVAHDTLTLASANNRLTIVGTAASDTISFTLVEGNIDHGSIAGLGDNDHPQYLNISEYDAKGKILIGTGAGTFTALSVGSDDHVLTADSGESSGVKWAAGAGAHSYVKVSEVQSSGTGGGTFTQDAWQTRNLNTEDNDADGICTLSSNQVTLDAGTYEVEGYAAAYDVNIHQCRLYNVTGTTVLILGSTQHTNNTYNAANASTLSGQFTIAASQALELQHRCVATKADQGFGVSAAFGTDNVFSYLIFRKVG